VVVARTVSVMAFDPEYVAAVEREQQRLIWEEIARLRKANYKRAWQALKRKGDLQSHRRKRIRGPHGSRMRRTKHGMTR